MLLFPPGDGQLPVVGKDLSVPLSVESTVSRTRPHGCCCLASSWVSASPPDVVGTLRTRLCAPSDLFESYQWALWWLSLHAYLTGPRDVQRTGQTLFLEVSPRVSLDEINIWVNKLNNVGGHHSIYWGPMWNRKAKKEWLLSLSVPHVSAIRHQTFWSLGLWTPGLQHWPPGIRPCLQIADHGLPIFQNHVRQFL